MTNKLLVIINSLKVPKIKKILLDEMNFLVPNYSCLQNFWLGGLVPPDPHSLCPLSSTEFVEPPPPPEQNSWVRHCLKLHSVVSNDFPNTSFIFSVYTPSYKFLAQRVRVYWRVFLLLSVIINLYNRRNWCSISPSGRFNLVEII